MLPQAPAGEAIPVSATLTYLGPADGVTLSGEFPDATYFSLEQLDGPLDMPGGGSRLICYDTALSRGVPDAIPFVKSGAFESSTPDAAFWTTYFSDPVLHLPAGSWRVSAHVRAAIGTECSTVTHVLDTAATFEVRP
jgi:hypothetical protein